MHRWFESLPSSLLMQAEKAQLEKILPTILGEYLIQIGGPSEFSLASPIRHKFYLTHDAECLSKHSQTILGDCKELPIYPQTIDLILLIHILEFLEKPLELLDQLYQTLVPSGQLIVISFNPISLWGLMHLWKRYPAKPWQGHFHPLWQAKHWLRKTGFQIVSAETFFFRPPVLEKKRDQHLLWLEAFGQLCLPGCGSVYIMSAQKREEGLTPIKIKSPELKIALNNQQYIKQPSHMEPKK